MSLVPGTKVVGRYVVERELAQGGMGAVYVARDEKFDKRVALKIASGSGALYEEFKARFVREARIVGTTPPRTASRPIATGTSRPIATTTWAFAPP